MTAFTGFPTGRNPFIPIPEVFFTQLLPEIEDSFELKLTLHIFWRLAQKSGTTRCINDRELLADDILLRSLRRRGDPRPAEERLYQALEQAVVRGTLVRATLKLFSENSNEFTTLTWYFFNTTRSRKIVREMEGGQMIPAALFNQNQTPVEEQLPAPASTLAIASAGQSNGKEPVHYQDVQVQVERPNIFVLYEQNIGLLSPMLADQLTDAEQHYPYEWIEDAFREAVQRNKRNWSYIRAILRRWETEGK